MAEFFIQYHDADLMNNKFLIGISNRINPYRLEPWQFFPEKKSYTLEERVKKIKHTKL